MRLHRRLAHDQLFGYVGRTIVLREQNENLPLARRAVESVGHRFAALFETGPHRLGRRSAHGLAPSRLPLQNHEGQKTPANKRRKYHNSSQGRIRRFLKSPLKANEQSPHRNHERKGGEEIHRGTAPARPFGKQKRSHHDVEQGDLVRGIHDEHVQKPQVVRSLRCVERHERHRKHEQLVHQNKALAPHASDHQQRDQPRQNDPAPYGSLDERGHGGIPLQPHPRRLGHHHGPAAHQRQSHQADSDCAVFRRRACKPRKRSPQPIRVRTAFRSLFGNPRPIRNKKPSGKQGQHAQQRTSHPT